MVFEAHLDNELPGGPVDDVPREGLHSIRLDYIQQDCQYAQPRREEVLVRLPPMVRRRFVLKG